MSDERRKDLETKYPSMKDSPTRAQKDKDSREDKDKPSPFQLELQALQKKYGKLLALDINADPERLKKILTQELVKQGQSKLSGASGLELKAVGGKLREHYSSTPSILNMRDTFVLEMTKAGQLAAMHLRDLKKAEARHQELVEQFPAQPSVSPMEKAAGIGPEVIFDKFDPPEESADEG